MQLRHVKIHFMYLTACIYSYITEHYEYTPFKKNRNKRRVALEGKHITCCKLVINHLVALTNLLLGPRQLSRYSDSLRAGRPGDRIPVEARFFAPVQTGPGAHSGCCTMGTGSFPGVKRPGRGANHSPHIPLRLKKEQSYIFTPSQDIRGPFQGGL